MSMRVDNNIYTNAYKETAVSKANKSQDAPAFLLNGDEEGVIWERSSEEKEKSTLSEHKAKDSKPKIDTYESIGAKEQKTVYENQTFDFKGLFDKAVESLKNLLKRFLEVAWYGNEDDAKDKDTGAETKLKKEMSSDTKMDNPTKENLIKESIARNDTDGVVRALTENYSIKPAHNSSLLTHYDKRGKITNVEGSQYDMIVKGDLGRKM